MDRLSIKQVFVIFCLHLTTASHEKDFYYNRHGRINPLIIPFWRVYVVPRTPCVSALNQQGICLARSRCDANNGSPSGSCAQRRGVCCIFQRTCGQSSSASVTYFANPEFPSPSKGGNRCTLQINKANTNICQLRIDFLDFTLAQPTTAGICENDFFSIDDTLIPAICGANTNQHVYVDFNTQCDFLQLSIDTNANFAFDRKWNLMISQITCNSTSRAPRGCLQFYTSTSGSVSSFNYGSIVPTMTGTENRQLTGMNYGICVQPASDYCGIEWSMTDTNSFSVSGNSLAQPGIPEVGDSCDHNFLVIPNPIQNGMPVGADRFCGTSFDTTTTSSRPYVLTVVTNYEEGEDIGDRGFQLNFRQMLCRPNSVRKKRNYYYSYMF